ncbi:MAG TPA: T9SS type A sorting domain-containing protein [Chitinophagaceae bacterium]|nr:T9SS type A sorting domain-containing protein [Chitinophagaceae bacterium]
MKHAYPVTAVIAVVLLFVFSGSYAQTSCPNFPDMKQKKVTGLTIGSYIKGLLEYTPPGYNPAGTTVYPLIIYFHGVGEMGNGTSSDLCNILTPTNENDIPLPERIEDGQLPTNAANQFIILSPQYIPYTYPTNYPSAPDVQAMINYAIINYKVDISRIYLTGMSSGSNMVIEYVAASQDNAERVAAIAISSLCSSVGNNPNGPAHIAAADLPVWEVHCGTDATCHDSIAGNWVQRINSQPTPPSPQAQQTILGAGTCAPGQHNAWNTLYDPAFTTTGTNVYDWFLQFNRGALLPANLKNYTAVLRGGKVHVEWTTTAENNTDRFILEKANGSSLQYTPVATITAAGASSTEKRYVLIDDQPSKGVNLYRLVLVNKDGRRENFDTKRVNVPNGQGGYVNIPTPIKGVMMLYVNVERTQNVNITVHDLNGRIVYRSNKSFAPGLSENRVNVASLPSGTYFVKVAGQEFNETRKVVIN